MFLQVELAVHYQVVVLAVKVETHGGRCEVLQTDGGAVEPRRHDKNRQSRDLGREEEDLALLPRSIAEAGTISCSCLREISVKNSRDTIASSRPHFLSPYSTPRMRLRDVGASTPYPEPCGEHLTKERESLGPKTLTTY